MDDRTASAASCRPLVLVTVVCPNQGRETDRPGLMRSRRLTLHGIPVLDRGIYCPLEPWCYHSPPFPCLSPDGSLGAGLPQTLAGATRTYTP
jgi:hypothetical protein